MEPAEMVTEADLGEMSGFPAWSREPASVVRLPRVVAEAELFEPCEAGVWFDLTATRFLGAAAVEGLRRRAGLREVCLLLAAGPVCEELRRRFGDYLLPLAGLRWSLRLPAPRVLAKG